MYFLDLAFLILLSWVFKRDLPISIFTLLGFTEIFLFFNALSCLFELYHLCCLFACFFYRVFFSFTLLYVILKRFQRQFSFFLNNSDKDRISCTVTGFEQVFNSMSTQLTRCLNKSNLTVFFLFSQPIQLVPPVPVGLYFLLPTIIF